VHESRDPRSQRGVEESLRPEDVRLDERARVSHGSIDMRLGGEVDDRVDAGQRRVQERGVADVAVDERVSPAPRDRLEVGEVAAEPRLKGLTLRTLEWVSRTAIRQREHNPELCCHLQLLN